MITPSSSERPPQTEKILYALIFILALAVRLLLLGRIPLNEAEARWALQAFDFSHKQSFIVGSQPAYVILTGTLFFLFSSSNGLARFLPALTGSLLVFLPLLFRRFTGHSTLLRRAGILLALGLALDPGLTAISRQAGSPMMAISLGLLALGLIFDCRPVWAGICAGLAILSGPALIQGALGLGLSFLLMKLVDKNSLNSLAADPSGESHLANNFFSWRKFVIVAAGTILLIGTALFMFPQGLAGLADIFSDYIQSWVSPSGVQILLVPAAIFLYQPLAILLGLLSIGRAWLNPRTDAAVAWLGRLLGFWFIIALALGMLPLGRQVPQAAWALVPLMGLAAIELAHYLPMEEILSFLRGRYPFEQLGLGQTITLFQSAMFIPIAAGEAVVLVLFGALVWNNLLRLSVAQAPIFLYAAVLGGILLMTVVILLLVSAGWSIGTALRGLMWGLVILLGFYTLVGTWRDSQYPFGESRELWTTSPAPGQIQELVSSLTFLSAHTKNVPDALDVTIAIPSPAIQWALRMFDPVTVVSQVSPTALPSIIITTKDQPLAGRAATYRGESLVWSLAPAWPGPLPPDLLRWASFRDAPDTAVEMIFWVRNDLFPGGTLNPTDQTSPAQNNP